MRVVWRETSDVIYLRGDGQTALVIDLTICG